MKILTWPVVAGAALGIIAPLLSYNGNPANMGFCAACFLRDTAGAIGLHQATPVQYIRPELIGLVLGAFASALLSKQFQPRGGAAPLTRLVLGFFAMLGALIFLGCPWRAYLRLGGGDLTSLAGIIGLFAGVWGSLFFVNRGFSLGKNQLQHSSSSLIGVLFSLVLLILLISQFKFSENGAIFSSVKGPASQHANLWLSLAAGALLGVVMQKSRFCTIGAFRNFILWRDSHLLKGVLALIICTSLTNLVLGQFKLGFSEQPIAHNDYIYNFLAMALCGLCFALAGGCPGKQLVNIGEGNNDAALFVLGMLLGAATAHNFSLAASGTGVAAYTPYVLTIGFAVCAYIGFSHCSTE